MTARFSIGIDLGTTNSALAYVPLTGDAAARGSRHPAMGSRSTALARRRRCPRFSTCRRTRLPRRSRQGAGDPRMDCRPPRPPKGEAKRPAGSSSRQSPGCVTTRPIASAPIPALGIGGTCAGAEDLAASAPRRSSSIICGERGTAALPDPGCAFDDQEITVTVPASFDAAAQRLTLNAAEEAGFPEKRSAA